MGETKKIDWLESLRGIACIIVVVTHIVSFHPLYGDYVVGCGKIGVWFFFLLSAFLIAKPYFSLEKKVGKKEIASFYIKRIVRIYPCYFIILLISLFFGFIETNQQFFNHLLLIEGASHFWAIPVEFKFYIVAPVVIYLICKLQNKKYSLWIFTLVGLFFSLMFPFTTYVENSISLYWYLPVFIIGVLTSYFYVTYQKFQTNKKIFDVIGIFIILIFIVSSPGMRLFLFKIQPDRYLQNKYIFITIGWAIILLCIQHGKIIKTVLSKSRILKLAGAISFPLYLIHYIVLTYATRNFSSYKVIAVFVIITSVLLALIMHFIIEVPITKCMKKTISNKQISFKKVSIILLCALIFTSAILYTGYIRASEKRWDNELYVPTMIKKINDDYFIVDCWNHRVIYNSQLDDDINQWKTLTDESYKGGHTIASDGQIYVLDDTDNNRVLSYSKTAGNFQLNTVKDGIGNRPHFVVYDEVNKYFYVIGSLSGTISTFKNKNGELELVREDLITELVGSYVRSISIIDGKLYTVSGPGKILEFSIQKNYFEKSNEFIVGDELWGMNQIQKFNDKYYITINTDKNGDVNESDIISVDKLSELKNKNYISLKDKLGFVGQPYFMTLFDDRIYVTEISETSGNGIRSFKLDENNTISDRKTFLNHTNVKKSSIERYNSKYIEEVDLFVFMGQSNMSGKGDFMKAPLVEKGYEFRAVSDPYTLYPIQEPFGLAENRAYGINDTVPENGNYKKLGGMVASFANSYYKESGVPIVGISASKGATKIDEWLPGTALYNDAIDRLEKARQFLEKDKRKRIRATYLVWCQGESDGDVGTSSTDYYNKLKKIIETMISNKNIETAFIIRIGENALSENKYDSIIDSQTKLCEDNRNVVLVSTQFADMKERGMMYDEYHYNQEGYNIVGQEAGKNAAIYSKTKKAADVFDYKYKVTISD